MVSEHQSADTSRRERYPEIAAQIGEDPARWLDHDLMARSTVRQQADNAPGYNKVRLVEDTKVSTYGPCLRSRIAGIDSLSVIARWLEVEHKLERGPRERVVELLQERAEELKEIGERPDRLPHGPRLPPEWTFEESVAPARDQTTAAEKLATDGGRDV